MRSSEVIGRLKSEGWTLVNVEGSHQQFKHHKLKGRVTVPHPKKDLPRGALRSIYK
ncbi:MAG: type II toxin-antitoxin system HicA family toxin [Thermosynechococcaceae cyanobacterium]